MLILNYRVFLNSVSSGCLACGNRVALFLKKTRLICANTHQVTYALSPQGWENVAQQSWTPGSTSWYENIVNWNRRYKIFFKPCSKLASFYIQLDTTWFLFLLVCLFVRFIRGNTTSQLIFTGLYTSLNSNEFRLD